LLGEPLDDPLLLFSVLYGLWVADYNTFDGDAVQNRAAQYLAAAEGQGTTVPLMTAHRLMGISLAHIGNFIEGRAHFDSAKRLFDPVKHRPLATRFGQDIGVSILFQRTIPLWILGYPDAALADADEAMSDARAIGLATTLMPALLYTSITNILCGNDATAKKQAGELVLVADEKGSALWKAFGNLVQGAVLAQTGNSADARQTLILGIGALRSTGSTLWTPLWSAYLAKCNADLHQFTEGWRFINEAMTVIETSKERLFEAEVNRMAGEIALLAPERDVRKAETLFTQALAVAKAQSAKSWELRAAMSLARVWRDRGERRKAQELLLPVYNWFTEGFRTADLLEAKTLTEQLQ
jgi:predicted ATPase